MTFYENLERIMQEKGVSGYQLHKDLGINPSTLNRWKNGSFPTIDKIPLLTEYFNVTSDELLGIKRKHPEPTNEQIMEMFKQMSDNEKIKFIGQLTKAANS